MASLVGIEVTIAFNTVPIMLEPVFKSDYDFASYSCEDRRFC